VARGVLPHQRIDWINPCTRRGAFFVMEALADPYDLRVVQPDQLASTLPAKIAHLPGRYNFKPHIGRLPDGEILLFASHTHSEEIATSQNVDLPARSINTHVVLYRSNDDSRSWGRGRHVRELIGGHEPSVSIIDGILLVTVNIHGSGWFPDPFAERDHFYVVVARSEDRGETFTTTIFDRAATGATDDDRVDCSRNILRLPNGRLWLGLGLGARHRVAHSDDLGRSWTMADARVEGVGYEGISRSFFIESLAFYSPWGRLMMLARVDFGFAKFANPLPHDPQYAGGTGLDQFDGQVLFTSEDDGLTWTPVRAVGFPALMYPSIVNLDESRMLLTYTVREIPPEDSGSIHRKVGIQAIVVEAQSDGSFDFDFSRDVAIVDDSTPASMRNAGGFGNTLRLPDGTLITPFSYPLIDPDILALADRKEYLKEEVYDHWASLQTTYPSRYRDIVTDDPVLSELHLRRSFSALFLYGQAASKGGIATAVVRWKL